MTPNISLQLSYISLFLSIFKLELGDIWVFLFRIIRERKLQIHLESSLFPALLWGKASYSQPPRILSGQVMLAIGIKRRIHLLPRVGSKSAKDCSRLRLYLLFSKWLEVFVTVLIHLPLYLLSYTHSYLSTLAHIHTYTNWDTTNLHTFTQ